MKLSDQSGLGLPSLVVASTFGLTISGKMFSFFLRLDLYYGPGRGVYMKIPVDDERSDALWR